MSERVGIVDKVRKLLRLADSPNVHEAATAATQAQRIMDEHRIEEAVLALVSAQEQARADDVITDHSDKPLDTMGRFVGWKTDLADAIARANGCRAFFRRHGDGEYKGKVSIIVVGRESDRQAVEYLFAYLVREIGRLCRRSQRRKGRSASWGANFRHGAVHVIARRLKQERIRLWRELREKAPGDELCRIGEAIDLVRRQGSDVERWITKHMNVGDEPRENTHRWNPLAFASGMLQGKRIELASKRRLGEG